ncbi:HyaD/HybD family hydrogenase maturation endopeptidase [Mesorhizobium sp. ArgA1]
MGNAPRVLVLGIGNLLWADEGFGIRAVEAFHRRFEDDPAISVVDGGTQGIYLVQNIRETDILVVFDAVDYQLAPGTMKFVEGDDVPNFLGIKKMSLHQTGFQEVLAMAQMMGDYPGHLLLVGVQPVELEDFGGSLRPQVKACIEPALDHAAAWLRALGIDLRERAQPLSEEETIASMEMALKAYETGRPHEAVAPRHGDERVLASGRFSPPADPAGEIAGLIGDVSGSRAERADGGPG